MKWLDRLLARPPAAHERALDHQALEELHDSFDNVQRRTDRLEKELRRVNAELRKQRGTQ